MKITYAGMEGHKIYGLLQPENEKEYKSVVEKADTIYQQIKDNWYVTKTGEILIDGLIKPQIDFIRQIIEGVKNVRY